MFCIVFGIFNGAIPYAAEIAYMIIAEGILFAGLNILTTINKRDAKKHNDRTGPWTLFLTILYSITTYSLIKLLFFGPISSSAQYSLSALNRKIQRKKLYESLSKALIHVVKQSFLSSLIVGSIIRLGQYLKHSPDDNTEESTYKLPFMKNQDFINKWAFVGPFLITYIGMTTNAFQPLIQIFATCFSAVLSIGRENFTAYQFNLLRSFLVNQELTFMSSIYLNSLTLTVSPIISELFEQVSKYTLTNDSIPKVIKTHLKHAGRPNRYR